ncbi:MAG: hypothetical protein KDD34_02865 [Bdellovibrionales bacterium]|nr:hypothetical protein [Bdellovibrionales bacterium]
MSKHFHNIKIGIDEDLEEKISWLVPDFSTYKILKKSVDARQRHSPHLVYSLEVFEKNETPPSKQIVLEKISKAPSQPALIIGAGPAGLFAALRLLERGIPVRLFEQGSIAEKRLFKINRFWRYGELNERNNVGFGEGGAGLYSDGKLITRIKSPYIPYVLKRLVDFGAPEEILYLSNPHVGSDKIRRLIPKLRQHIIDQGGLLHYDTKICEFLFDSHNQLTGVKTENSELYHGSQLILACGHSADDIFYHLSELGVFMEGKSFAMGLRIEHSQKIINQIQYREFSEHPKLGAANYRLAHHDKKTETGVYSFCMCPGGYVLSSGTKSGQLVTNGMSNFNRSSKYANAAIVVSIDHKKSFGEKNIFAGLELRNHLEKQAFDVVQKAGGTKQLPKQKVIDFIEKRLGSVDKGSTPSGSVPARLDLLFNSQFHQYMQQALEDFDRKMKGFINPEAQFYGVESRTSCPLRITRNKETLESLSHKGLYPTGEGAGYAGGITSAACDGILVADKIYETLSSQILKVDVHDE